MDAINVLITELYNEGYMFKLSAKRNQNELKLELDHYLEVHYHTEDLISIERFGTILFQTKRIESILDFIKWYIDREDYILSCVNEDNNENE